MCVSYVSLLILQYNVYLCKCDMQIIKISIILDNKITLFYSILFLPEFSPAFSRILPAFCLNFWFPFFFRGGGGNSALPHPTPLIKNMVMLVWNNTRCITTTTTTNHLTLLIINNFLHNDLAIFIITVNVVFQVSKYICTYTQCSSLLLLMAWHCI